MCQLGEAVKITTDGKTKIGENQKFNLIEAVNRAYVKKLWKCLTTLKEDPGHL